MPSRKTLTTILVAAFVVLLILLAVFGLPLLVMSHGQMQGSEAHMNGSTPLACVVACNALATIAAAFFVTASRSRAALLLPALGLTSVSLEIEKPPPRGHLG